MPPRSDIELDSLSNIDPEIDAIVKSGKISKLISDFSDPYKALGELRAVAETWGGHTEKEGVRSTTASYKTRDGLENRLLIFRPMTAETGSLLKAYLHMHGGGGCIGSPESTTAFCQELALQQHCAVFSVQYRLGPEHKFPSAVQDCTDAAIYMLKNAAEFGIDPAMGFVIGGHSMGASMAAVISRHAAEIGLAGKITGLYLGAGAFVGSMPPQGYEGQLRSRSDPKCLDTPIYDHLIMMLFKEMSGNDIGSPWCRACNHSSINAPQPEPQPRSYFQVCGLDYLRDDGLIYEDLIRSHGTETRLDIYPGASHLFWEVFKVRQTNKWAQDTQDGFYWLFQGS